MEAPQVDKIIPESSGGRIRQELAPEDREGTLTLDLCNLLEGGKLPEQEHKSHEMQLWKVLTASDRREEHKMANPFSSLKS